MKPHYFHQEKADEDDYFLQLSIDHGYVPEGCLMGGSMVWTKCHSRSPMDPCEGCDGPREKCHGRITEEDM